jgi:type II secretory pathway pseudopilin PulG
MSRGGSRARTSCARANEAGFSIAVLLAGITIMFITMGAAVPTWRYVMKNDREEELYFRGDQIARAIERYQRKNANSLPVSFETLVKGRYLRKIYKDPMSKDGKWRIIHPGEAMLPGGVAGGGQPGEGQPGSGFGGTGTFGQPGQEGSLGPAGRQPGSQRPNAPMGPLGGGTGGPGAGAQMQGAIIGVASTSQDKSLRIFNGRTRYDQWLFVANQPRLLGGDQGRAQLPGGGGLPGGVVPSPKPFGAPGQMR